jgi:hypothetical protein
MSIDWKAEYLKSVESGCITLDELREARAELTAIKQALAAPTSAEYAMGYAEGFNDGCKPAPVQEPVACVIDGDLYFHHEIDWEDLAYQGHGVELLYTAAPAAPVLEGRDWSLLEATQESLREHMSEIKRLKAAQPAVPDAIGPNDDELPAYAAGWNDCRQAMMEMMK